MPRPATGASRRARWRSLSPRSAWRPPPSHRAAPTSAPAAGSPPWPSCCCCRCCWRGSCRHGRRRRRRERLVRNPAGMPEVGAGRARRACCCRPGDRRPACEARTCAQTLGSGATWGPGSSGTRTTRRPGYCPRPGCASPARRPAWRTRRPPGPCSRAAAWCSRLRRGCCSRLAAGDWTRSSSLAMARARRPAPGASRGAPPAWSRRSACSAASAPRGRGRGPAPRP
mmetsp:Transcript_6381/g.17780  ORF Transcript_6381/g.17780 Transcript_6381/m.17780 type:complete len:227 (-) Transcript_6381:417-1097(-)